MPCANSSLLVVCEPRKAISFPVNRSVRRMKNPIYCGLIVHKSHTYKGSFPALVSEDLWHSVQDSLRGKKKAVPKKTVDEKLSSPRFPEMRLLPGKAHRWPRQRSGARRMPQAEILVLEQRVRDTRLGVSREKLEADWLLFLEGMQPAFDALVNVLPVLAKANAHKRGCFEDAEQRQRHLATQLSESEGTAQLSDRIENFAANSSRPSLERWLT